MQGDSNNIAKAIKGAAGMAGLSSLGGKSSGNAVVLSTMEDKFNTQKRTQAEERLEAGDDDFIEGGGPEPTDTSAPKQKTESTAPQPSADANSGQPAVETVVAEEENAALWKALVPSLVEVYDKIQGFGAIKAYDYIVDPVQIRAEYDKLHAKYKNGTHSEIEKKRYLQLHDIIAEADAQKQSYAASVNMMQPIKDALVTMLDKVAEVKAPKLNPMRMIFVLLLIQPVINIVGLLILKTKTTVKG